VDLYKANEQQIIDYYLAETDIRVLTRKAPSWDYREGGSNGGKTLFESRTKHSSEKGS